MDAHVVANEGFISTAYNAAVSYNSFKDLQSNYMMWQAGKQTTKLTKSLEQVEKSITELKGLLLQASTIH